MVQEESFVPKFVFVVIVFLTVSMITLALIQGLRRPDSSMEYGTIDVVQADQEFIPGQAITASLENVTVYVPQDSTNLVGNLSIIPLGPNLFTSVSETEWNRPEIVNIEFRTSEGTTHVAFSNPIEVCFNITEEQWQNFLQQPGGFQIQYYAEEKVPPVWELLPMTTHPELSQLCGQTFHLSVFALAIRSQAIIPIAGSIPTSTLSSAAPSASFGKLPELNSKTDPPDIGPATVPTNPLPTNPPPTDPPPNDPLPTDPPTVPVSTDPPLTDSPPTDLPTSPP